MTTPCSLPKQTPDRLVRLSPEQYRSRFHLSFPKRALVLDYLCQQCYAKTARAFLTDSMVRDLDADGEEIQSLGSTLAGLSDEGLSQVGLRASAFRDSSSPLGIDTVSGIHAHIVAGRVDDATDLLNEHFPSVLSGTISQREKPISSPEQVLNKTEYTSPTSTNPAHLSLNLRILSFIEACRTTPLEYPEQTPEPGSASLDVQEDPLSLDKKLTLLSKAQKLFGLANMLGKSSDREVYLKELNNVSGLLAYKVPERSSIARYLSQERREAVADQVNRAILGMESLFQSWRVGLMDFWPTR